jgi:hypothetical protein
MFQLRYASSNDFILNQPPGFPHVPTSLP